MPIKERNTVESSLQKKGFVIETDRDHRYFFYHSKNGKKTKVHTKISHSPKYKTIGDNLIALMSKQCGLSKSDFIDLIDCPLSRDKYESKLIAQGIISN